jgi:hypothetical protein
VNGNAGTKNSKHEKPRSNTGLTGSRTSDVQGAVSFQIGWGQNGKRLLSIISRARVSELERIVAGKHRPPSRLANVFRYLVSNIDTLEQIVEDWKSREQHKPATPNG